MAHNDKTVGNMCTDHRQQRDRPVNEQNSQHLCDILSTCYSVRRAGYPAYKSLTPGHGDVENTD